MNYKNVDKAIAIMSRVNAARFSMLEWQTNADDPEQGPRVYARSEKELHACGNFACFAGYVAVSPEFRADGGSVVGRGSPRYRSRSMGASAIADWLGITGEEATRLVHKTDPEDGAPYYPVPWESVTPQHVIDKLLELKYKYQRRDALSRYNAGEEPKVSHGICGRLSVGYGELDANGYWEFPLLP